MGITKFFLIIFFSGFLVSMAQGNKEGIENGLELEPNGLMAFNGRWVTKINPVELPESVIRMLTNGEFQKWEINEAYHIFGGSGRLNGQASYIVVVKKRENRFALYYDSEGKLIRQELMDFFETSLK